MNTATYARLLTLAREVVNAGYSVVVDATFLKDDDRAPFIALAAACETTAGLCFILGLHVRLVSLLLFAFTVLVSILLHAFWTFTGEERTVQMIMFLKNIALSGGLLAFAGFGPGKLSLDHWFGKGD